MDELNSPSGVSTGCSRHGSDNSLKCLSTHLGTSTGRFRSEIGRNSYYHRFCGATLHDIQVLGCPVAESWNFILAAQVSCWHLTSRHTIAQLRTNEWNPYLNGPELPLCTSQLAGMNGSHWRLQGNELHLSSSSNPIVTPNTAEGQPGGLGPGS
jgi:hypothetical protein